MRRPLTRRRPGSTTGRERTSGPVGKARGRSRAAVWGPAGTGVRIAVWPTLSGCAMALAKPSGSPSRSPSSSAAGVEAGFPCASSNSATVANAGSPADAARDLAEPSGATIERARFRACASRASSRKLIREVATREPAGRTSATRASSAARIRAAAEVISSSMSR